MNSGALGAWAKTKQGRWCWRSAAILVALLLVATSATAADTLRLSRLFSDGVVLQRDRPMHVWGWDRPGATVHVELDGHAVQASAAADGRWTAVLPAHAAGGPFVLRVRDDHTQRRIADVMIGDVWLCSGQSNMEFTVAQGDDAAAEVAHSGSAAVRQFKIPKTWALHPRAHLAGGTWQQASPWTTGTFSAVCWFFARDMQAHTGVPQGMINSSWGGSRIEAWLGAAAAGVSPTTVAAQVRRQKRLLDAELANTRRHLARWSQGGDTHDKDWSAAHLETSDWATIRVPADWETQGYADMDGIAWYRTRFRLSAAEAAHGIWLGLGKIDDSDRSYVNGHPVGHTDMQWNAARRYRVPASVLHAGVNSIAVRVHDFGGGGGIHGDPSLLYVQTEDGHRRPLAGSWKFRPGNVVLAADPYQNLLPTLLYNRMIHPIVGYPLRGVVWYQGESNALPGQAKHYTVQFRALIRSWRRAWKQPDLPFLWVQLPNYKSGEDANGNSPWAELRASQTAALALPHTGQAVTIDLGDPNNIHPTDKQDVGHRLALVARHVVFGENLIDNAPAVESVHFADGRAVIRFALSGDHLAVRGGGRVVHGFELAGADHRYHPATAELDGDHVVVHCDDVSDPVAVRYAWSDNPVAANLVDAPGLPVAPFRYPSRPATEASR